MGFPLEEKLIDINNYPVAKVLKLLLQDKSTNKNIIWATDTYEAYGVGFTDKEELDEKALKMRTDIIRPRILKSLEEQAQRTRKKAEVFTPAWLCNRMNNYCDEDWFGRPDVFNKENEDRTWMVTEGKIAFPEKKTWQQYVDSRRLEITCGEAPYLVSRYDVSTGKFITPPLQRIGILDRKLRIINENTDTYEDWLEWTIRAFEASYGYEYQGDNVLIARINLLLTFMDYYEERWGKKPDDKLLERITIKIVRNIWQMDGLKDTVPLGKPYEEFKQMSLFDLLGGEDEKEDQPEAVPCSVYNWRSGVPLRFMDIKEMRGMGKKLFDYVIGNPPYQITQEVPDDSEGNKTYAKPVYNEFLDASYSVADKVEMIHPARFLFNAGSTPKGWNEKMLNDPHIKVLMYKEDASQVFPSTEIKGGVCVSYYDELKNFEPIGVFTKFPELNSLLHKVVRNPDYKGMNEIAVSRTAYRLTDKMHEDHPEARYVEDENGKKVSGLLSKGHDYDMSTNIFERIPAIFYDEMPNDGQKYIRILGRVGNGRSTKWIRRDYVNSPKPLDSYTIILPKANNTGQFGETLSQPVITEPGVGTTETFLSVGYFATEEESQKCLQYVSTKFARTMLGILKTTQDLTPDKWKYVPLQDFTLSSDIDWSKSIHEIDLQLYRKYGLDEKEIAFIETHVKEMV